MHCFVINLERDTVRREQIEQQLQALGLGYEVFPAVNGKALGPGEMARHYDVSRATADKRHLSAGEVGCALSHQGVYQEMVRRGLPSALVLEDDARLDPGIQPILCALEPLLLTDKPLVILLNCVKLTSYWATRSLVGRHVVAPVLNGTWGAHGYVLNRAAARSLLEHLYPVRLPADIWDRFRKEGLVEVRAVVPYCIGLTDAAMHSTLSLDRSPLSNAEKRSEEIGWKYLAHRYLYRKLAYQILVRPFIRKQSMTW